MKAYMVFSGEPQWGCILVYADNRNKAKAKCVGWSFDWDYVEMNAKRKPEFDKYYPELKHDIVDENAELPEGAPAFYANYEV